MRIPNAACAGFSLSTDDSLFDSQRVWPRVLNQVGPWSKAYDLRTAEAKTLKMVGYQGYETGRVAEMQSIDGSMVHKFIPLGSSNRYGLHAVAL